MILSLTAINKKGELRQFDCWLDSFDVALDVLNHISAKDQLLQAKLKEQGCWLFLPVEAFDGESVMPPLQALKAEWEPLLQDPIKR